MTSLIEAVNASATTDNGAVTNVSSLNKNVDLFFQIGASRGKDVTPAFAAALAEDSEVAVRIIEWARDVRGGSGERQTFRDLFGYLIRTEPALAERVLVRIPELGRWDDIFVAFGTVLERKALQMIVTALTVTKDGLCAKWMPRQGPVANKIRNFLQFTPKGYRKTLVGLSATVEQKMCAREWDNIEYSHVPSVAAGRYQKAFLKHDPVGYGAFKEKLVTGEAKINASAVYPYDVIKSLRHGDRAVSIAQWNALPNYLEGSDDRILPVVDVSGSMAGVATGSCTALDVAVSLGLYLSERSTGPFKDTFVTFSEKPELITLKGDLGKRLDQMVKSKWDMNTDLAKVFELLLTSAVTHSVPESEMPTKILILSDMEFDSCIKNGTSVSAMDFIAASYAEAGYKLPQVVFWNLNARAGNSPVTCNQVGAALVSGFSPSIVSAVLGSEEMSPLSVMLRAVMVKRYDF